MYVNDLEQKTMITMNELIDLRMQQQIAQEILYRQQIIQRIPDPFAPFMPLQMIPMHVAIPPLPKLPGNVEVKLENNNLWQQFHKIGTEMIITKCGRRMFPSMRVSLKGLEEEKQYCVLIEMVPLGDCRYKFSSSQWVPAGGAEPQSPQRMYLHPDSPATGSHWQAQPLLFNKVKLTNNTLDNNGHIVLASMHKYQPRIHVICTSDLTQIPWAPQQAFVFPETEFIAVTAYQNDRITKLKIDNNPFAKGFRETGQSRCKRKMSLSPDRNEDNHPSTNNAITSTIATTAIREDDQLSVASSNNQDSPQTKRLCSRNDERDHLSYMELNAAALRYDSRGYDVNVSCIANNLNPSATILTELMPSASTYYTQLGQPMPVYGTATFPHTIASTQFTLNMAYNRPLLTEQLLFTDTTASSQSSSSVQLDEVSAAETFVDVVSTSSEESQSAVDVARQQPKHHQYEQYFKRRPSYEIPGIAAKHGSFSISAILGGQGARDRSDCGSNNRTGYDSVAV
uniref:T-box domain-containing protein n=1 Tax=Glossina brevipalpis TaxID=37001 RepID=A0A1A9WT95_9MUSC